MSDEVTRRQIALLTVLVSEQAGQIRALEACLVGIMDIACREPQISGAIVSRLEQVYASSLSTSTNTVEHSELNETRERLLGVAEAAAFVSQHGTIQ